jgi:FAD/FMN-containing dehydrogenase
MGDIQVQTVAGAIQTGTHGTGRDTGGMAAQVAGLEMVLADGTIASCSAPSRTRTTCSPPPGSASARSGCSRR